MTTVPAGLTAAIDQAKTELRGLVRLAAEHQVACLCAALPCAGRPAEDVMARMGGNDWARLLHIAVAELARLGYAEGDGGEVRGYQQAVAVLFGVAHRTGSPAARWAADYLAADPDRIAPGAPSTAEGTRGADTRG